jgi:hypothetical protein
MFTQSSIAIISFALGLATMPSAKATYTFDLRNSNGTPIPFETFTVPETSRPTSISVNSKRALAVVEYVENWCGAVQLDPPSGEGTFTSVTGTWTVPVVTPVSGLFFVRTLSYIFSLPCPKNMFMFSLLLFCNTIKLMCLQPIDGTGVDATYYLYQWELTAITGTAFVTL